MTRTTETIPPAPDGQPDYFIGFVPDATFAASLQSVQADVRACYPGEVAEPLPPHSTILPPNVAKRYDRATLVPRVAKAMHGWSDQLVMGRYGSIKQILAFRNEKGDNHALVVPVISEDLTALRQSVFDVIGEEPATPLHITIARPTESGPLPEYIEIDYLAAIGNKIPEGFALPLGNLMLFDLTGIGRMYHASEPVVPQAG